MEPTPSRRDIETAKLRMLALRQELDDHERANGYAASSEHQRLHQEFKKATRKYLQLTESQH
jgi:hypothetical protein